VYELIHAERAKISMARACRVLAAEVKEVVDDHRGRYGAPRVRRVLQRRGSRPSKKRVARGEHGTDSVKRYRISEFRPIQVPQRFRTKGFERRSNA
jgi:hypothetical protein